MEKYDHKTNKENIFHNLQSFLMPETYRFLDWTDAEEIATFGNLQEHTALIKGKLEKNGIAIEEMHNISR